MKQIIVSHLSKIYNQNQLNEVRAIDDISFEVDKGEFIVILGASGAGKTTLLNLLGGMDTPTSGVYKIENIEVNKLKDSELTKFRKNDIGFVFQFYNLMPNLTALENISIAEAISEKKENKSLEVLEAVELKNRMNNFPSELSGGEQQRIAIARAIVKNPKLLLCDEPTGALDSKTGASIIKLLKKINKENNTTVIIVTHNAKIASIASRVIHIQDGKIFKDEINKDIKDPGEIEW